MGSVIAAIAGILLAGASTYGLVTVTNNAALQSSSTSSSTDGSGATVPNNANIVVYGSN